MRLETLQRRAITFHIERVTSRLAEVNTQLGIPDTEAKELSALLREKRMWEKIRFGLSHLLHARKLGFSQDPRPIAQEYVDAFTLVMARELWRQISEHRPSERDSPLHPAWEYLSAYVLMCTTNRETSPAGYAALRLEADIMDLPEAIPLPGDDELPNDD